MKVVTIGPSPALALPGSLARTTKRVVLCCSSSMSCSGFAGRRSPPPARRRWPPASGPGLGDEAGGAGRVGLRHRLDAELAQGVAALAERLGVRQRRLDRQQRGARQRQQLMAHAQEVLADDIAGRRPAAGGGCRPRAPPPSSRSGSWRSAPRRPSRRPAHPRRWRTPRPRGRETPRGRPGASWRRARPGRRRAASACARSAGARFALAEAAGDFVFGRPWAAVRADALRALRRVSGAASAPERMRRARSRSSGVLTSTGTVSTSVTSMRMPSSSARSCSSCSRFSSGEGLSDTNRSSAARR